MDRMIMVYIKGRQLMRDIVTWNCKGEFGVGSVLSIAVALIVSAFVLVPGMQKFADKIIVGMTDWWDVTISKELFPTGKVKVTP